MGSYEAGRAIGILLFLSLGYYLLYRGQVNFKEGKKSLGVILFLLGGILILAQLSQLLGLQN